eukprot:TRINITY_DN63431_c0_g1_i2.p1 TRINITY_DN63431_c0_g1~~TRINITY_DN63431_c0_g1_i2.p1  ORF type:complete len:148 (-),score=21.59 TRINITY_DN63431_c0_g1_i2:175-618(-)
MSKRPFSQVEINKTRQSVPLTVTKTEQGWINGVEQWRRLKQLRHQVQRKELERQEREAERQKAKQKEIQRQAEKEYEQARQNPTAVAAQKMDYNDKLDKYNSLLKKRAEQTELMEELRQIDKQDKVCMVGPCPVLQCGQDGHNTQTQ